MRGGGHDDEPNIEGITTLVLGWAVIMVLVGTFVLMRCLK